MSLANSRVFKTLRNSIKVCFTVYSNNFVNSCTYVLPNSRIMWTQVFFYVLCVVSIFGILVGPNCGFCSVTRETRASVTIVNAPSDQFGLSRAPEVPDGRPPLSQRLFTSKAVEQVIVEVGSRIRDDTIWQIFANCLPNTLDTTVYFRKNVTDPSTGLILPYTYLVTGDILAMWLRDSTQQVTPYIPLAKRDWKLRELILGIINTQAEMIELYPWGNAYFPLKHWNSGIKFNESEWSRNDEVQPPYPRDEVFEAKYELNSLASFLYLSKNYYEETGDAAFLNNPHWKSAVELILETLRAQQASSVEVLQTPPFKFSRPTVTQSETTNLYGIGNPVKRCGLVRSFFRPSDDSTIFQYLIPSNAILVVSLEGVAKILDDNSLFPDLSKKTKALASEVRAAIMKHGIVQHPEFGQVFAFEVDCYGSHVFMDDTNFPSLITLPKFGFVAKGDPIYLNTRRYILSEEWNPYFAQGKYPGVGSPHTGLQRPWHMAQAFQAMTSTNETEINFLLNILKNTTAGTGFMHESYNVNNASDFTRDWFSWANSVFGELILSIDKEYPRILSGDMN